MSFSKKTVRDINLADKIVLMRADYNVSIKNGRVIDDYRIRQSIETIKFIENAGAKKLIIISHLGRPEGKPSKEFSLEPVANHLADLLNKKIEFVADCVGEQTAQIIADSSNRSVILLENLRFYAQEEKNDADFAKALVDVSGAEVFVQDAFGASHRAHASTDSITKFLPAVSGLLLEKEVITLNQVVKEPKRPFTAVVGGAKIKDKIDVIERFIEIADCVVIGGALANDFLRAERIQIGASVLDDDSIGLAKELIAKARHAEKAKGFSFLIPVDAVVSVSSDGKHPVRVVDFSHHGLASLESYPKIPSEHSYTIQQTEKILDIGPVTSGLFAGAIRLSKTVVWSGTMGVTETKGSAGADDPYAHGTKKIVEAMISSSNQHANKPFTVVGGGDTVGYIETNDLVADFNHVSTGGSASLELLSGHKLPAVEVLLDK